MAKACLKDWGFPEMDVFLSAGPCSAESEEQVLATAHALKDQISFLRAGIWKPRTRPGSFEGVGLKGLGWMDRARTETGLKIGTEVAEPSHVEACLEYEADAGTRWAYHNGPYTLLESVVSEAAKTSFSAFFNMHLRNRIGMNGLWLSTNGLNNVYFSTARSMARFGLLNLNHGVWKEDTILGDMDYISDMINTSQELNKSYGYLWWLNGKESYMAPSLQAVFNGSLIPNAPADTYSGLGKNDQKLYIIPSKGLVVIRMGEDAGESLLGPTSFDNVLWEKISALIN